MNNIKKLQLIARLKKQGFSDNYIIFLLKILEA
jgi:hypothetical protein